MNITLVTEKDKSQLLLTIELLPEEYQSFLPKGAEKIAANINLPGFRPGKIPGDIIKQKFGQAEILKESLPDIITATYYQAIKEKNIDTLGQPEINILKMAPDNNLIYSAKVFYLPEFQLPDISSMTIIRPKISLTDKDIETLLEQLRRSRASEKLVEREARKDDLVKLDYQISLLDIPQEDGQQKNLDVYLGEHHMLPGFEEQIIGLKAGNNKKFSLKFPDDYFQKNFAGKNCDFDVKINGVYEIVYPELTEEFIKTLGNFSSLDDLKNNLRQNLMTEKEHEQNIRLENELFDKLIAATDFPPLPPLLIDYELDNIIHEFEHNLSSHGLKLDTWLENIHKSIAQFRDDLRPQGEKRAKMSLLVKNFAVKEKITVTDKELNEQLSKIEKNFNAQEENKKQIATPAYRAYLTSTLITQKTVDWLKTKIIK